MNLSRKQIFENFMDDMQRVSKSMMHEKHMHLHDLPFGQRAALFTIALHEKLPVKKLASELQITPGAATQHAEALVVAGLVERHEDTDDRRIVHLTMSKSGRKRLQELKKRKLESLEKMFQDINDQELQDFMNIMKKISNTMTNEGNKK